MAAAVGCALIPWAPLCCALTVCVLARVLPVPPAREDMPPLFVPAALTGVPPALLMPAEPPLLLMLLMGPLMAAPFDAGVPVHHARSPCTPFLACLTKAFWEPSFRAAASASHFLQLTRAAALHMACCSGMADDKAFVGPQAYGLSLQMCLSDPCALSRAERLTSILTTTKDCRKPLP